MRSNYYCHFNSIRYTFGDITNFVADAVGEKKGNERARLENGSEPTSPQGSNGNQAKTSILGGMDSALIAKELEEWDKKFLKDIDNEDLQTASVEGKKKL